jgi:hypothetical protein
VYVHGNEDVDGALRSIERIVTGLAWRAASAPVTVVGPPDAEALERCTELGATLAAGLMLAAG